jgi:transcriptional regulator with XRE-family HTH domain
MKGSDAIKALKKKLGIQGDAELASRLGVTHPSILYWKNRKNITPRQLANLVHSASIAATKRFQAKAIRPVVEFFRIRKCESARKAKFELFSITDEQGDPHPYWSGLKDELSKSCGVYVFFDSRGQAIYAGKTKGQSLWKEITLAFNRKRDSVQKIKRVRHPENRVTYRTSNEKSRQIVEYSVPLHEIASYFSAYEVDDAMINDLESLLVRSFANDLLNIRMERFTRRRKGAK